MEPAKVRSNLSGHRGKTAGDEDFAIRLHSDGVPIVRPLALSTEQSTDLVAFLRSLDAEPPPRPAPPPLCP